MYCFKCGNEISDDSQFCFKCGVAQKALSDRETNNVQTDNKDLDREAIKIYLSDVLALECAISKLNKLWCDVDNQIKAFEATNYNEQFCFYDDNYAWFRFDGNEFFVYLNYESRYNSYHLHFGEKSRNYPGAWCPVSCNMDYLNSDSTWPRKSSLNFGVDLLYDIFVNPSYKRSAKNGFFEAYEKFKEKAPQMHADNAKNIQLDVDKRLGISNEIEQATDLLQKAYDINLIPQQFRNIYAIWFIHDYIMTSKESLSSAFLQCNLDEIKQKLDTIIEQQKEIIINQKILRAQNNQIIEQNQQTIRRLANIEKNTERAAQYAEIASNNAEACAWIGVANYIKG